MPQNSTPAPRPLVHTVARILFLCVVGAIALVVATAPTQQQGMFNPGANLDTTNVTYLGFQPGEVGLAAGADVLEYGPDGDTAHSGCSSIDWTEVDPYDANGDGQIDCGSDLELGA